MRNKDLVHIWSDDGKLRLGWMYRGKRYRLSTGLPDTVAGRRALQRVVALYGELELGTAPVSR